MLTVLEQRVEQLKQEVAVEADQREQMIDAVTHNLEAELPSLMERIKTESIEREANDNETREVAVNQIRNLNEVIEAQRQLRADS